MAPILSTLHRALGALGPWSSTIVVFLLVPLSASVGAAPLWEFSDSLGAGLTFTDNVNQDTDNPESDMVVRLNPSFVARRRGSRLTLNASFSPTVNLFPLSDFTANARNSFTGLAASELVEDQVFLDVRARSELLPLGSYRSIDRDRLTRDEDVVNSFVYELTPHTRHHLGGNVDIQTQFRFGGSLVRSNRASNENNQMLRVNMLSGREFARAPWSVSVIQRFAQSDTRRDSGLELSGTSRWRYDNHWVFSGSAGWEDNDIQSNRQTTSGFIWNLGANWTPNRRTSALVRYGQRFFGDNWQVRVSHRSRRTVLAAGFSRDFQNRTRELVQTQFDVVRDDNGDPIVDESGNFFIDPASIQTVNVAIDDNYIANSYFVSGSINGRRDSLSFRLNQTQREFESSGRSEDYLQAQVGYRYQLSRRLTARIQLTADDEQGTAQDGLDWSVNVGLSQQLGRELSVTTSLQHQQFTDSLGTVNENRLNIGVRLPFL